VQAEGDTVLNVGLHSLEDLSGALDSIDNGGKTWSEENNIGGCLCGFSGTFDTHPGSINVGHLPYSIQTSIVTVVVIWGYSIGTIIVVAISYFVLTKMSSINNLGRHKRSRADTQMENILSHLSRIAIEHETDVHGKSKWVLGSKSSGEAEEE